MSKQELININYLAISDLVNRAFKLMFKLIEIIIRYRTQVLTSVASHTQLKAAGFFSQNRQLIEYLFLSLK